MKLPHTSLEGKHLPVMIDEVVKICNPKNGGIFMDCTFGAGGYSKEFLKFPETQIVAIDYLLLVYHPYFCKLRLWE